MFTGMILFLLSVAGYFEIAYAINKASFRLRGLGTNLIGFVDDLYSDIYLNPAYISRYTGTHIFTNLSNMRGAGTSTLFGQSSAGFNKTGEFPSNLIGVIRGDGIKKWGLFWESSNHELELKDSREFTSFSTLINGFKSDSHAVSMWIMPVRA